MSVMIHSWHAGAQLDLNYSFAGVVATEITYPQNVANCTTCHQGVTAQGALGAPLDDWQTNPSFTACFSCHVGGNVTPLHPFNVTPATNCTTCHNTADTTKMNVAIAHNSADTIFATNTAKQFQYTIDSVTGTAPGQNPVVKLTVLFSATGAAPFVRDEPHRADDRSVGLQRAGRGEPPLRRHRLADLRLPERRRRRRRRVSPSPSTSSTPASSHTSTSR